MLHCIYHLSSYCTIQVHWSHWWPYQPEGCCEPQDIEMILISYRLWWVHRCVISEVDLRVEQVEMAL